MSGSFGRSIFSVAIALGAVGLAAFGVACGDDSDSAPTAPDGSSTDGAQDGGPSGTDGGGADGGGDAAVAPTTIDVMLQPEVSSTASRRVSFAVPLPPGRLTSENDLQVRAAGTVIPAARRALAKWPGGSLRSVQLQIDIAVPAATTITVTIGEAGTGSLSAVPVQDTLTDVTGGKVPSVWAILPATWLAASRVAGPARPSAEVVNTPAAAWDRVCDYATFGTTAFDAAKASAEAWLFDRPTALYRGYQRTGSASVLRSAYLEAGIYRDGITGTGAATRIAVPGADDDLKYHYTQGLAVHYLLTGDDRFRESAEDVGVRAHDLWLSPGYSGGADFWTERHAGFGLLAYEWAAAVSDDERAQFVGWAAEAVTAYLAVQSTYPSGYSSTTERCFAHTSEAHGEAFGTFGCSPWMSAILADALDAHADRLALEGDTAGAAKVRTSLVQLGRFMMTQGRDPSGKPFYWAGFGVDGGVPDEFDEHWGETAYLVALAWAHSGKSDATLKAAADALVAGMNDKGEVGQIRSFNWQCRTAVMTPFHLGP